MNFEQDGFFETVETEDEQQTFEFAKRFSKILKPGDFVALFGGLGVGKTAFVRGLCAGLGFSGNVCSPTFVIVNEYETKNFRIIHCDMYRIAGEEDLFSVGFFDYLNNRNILVIEWSENILQFLPRDCFRVKIECLNGDRRLIRLEKGVC